MAFCSFTSPHRRRRRRHRCNFALFYFIFYFDTQCERCVVALFAKANFSFFLSFFNLHFHIICLRDAHCLVILILKFTELKQRQR